MCVCMCVCVCVYKNHTIGANPTLNWKRFIENKNKEIARLNGIYQVPKP